MKRRMMAALLAAVMTATMAAGCGSGGSGSDGGSSDSGSTSSDSSSGEEAGGGEITLKVFSNLPDRKTGQLLLDVQMPLKNGIEVMQAAKNAGLDPVIVILSGHDEFKYAQQALRYGAKEYLLKPVRASDILKCLNQMADKYFDKGKEESGPEDAESSNYFIKMAKEYIAEHYTENISLVDAAEAAGISAGYLSTMFTQYLNCGFVDYLNQVRIERACCYLEQKCFKNYEVAFKVGFRDEKYFSKVFKKIMGMTPREYRNQKNTKRQNI